MSDYPIVRNPLGRLVASLGFLALASSGLPVQAEPGDAPPAGAADQAPSAPSAPVRVADATQTGQVVPSAAAGVAAAAATEEPETAEEDSEDLVIDESAPKAAEPAMREPPAAHARPARAAANLEAAYTPPATFDLKPSSSVPSGPASAANVSVMGTVITPQPLRPEEITRAQAEYLQQRYDLSSRTHPTITMSGGSKHIPVGPTARLTPGMTWDKLARMTPEEIKKRGAFPFTPLWHPAQDKGGMVFPPVQTAATTGLARNDLLYDLPSAYLPEFPAPLYLTSRPDLGDVSQGQLITNQNVDALLRDVLTPTQLEGVKAMLQKSPTLHHNRTSERATEHAVDGVACMDCHVNGHTTAQFSLTADMRPQSERFRMDTASLRGLYMQSWFGAKRSVRSLEQFIPSEQATYFDGDTQTSMVAGGRTLTPREVDAMAQFIRIVDFPPAPKLGGNGELDKRLATASELHGEKLFQKHCQGCHTGPAFTDSMAHDLKVERFYDHVGSTRVGNPGRAEGAMKTPSLRGLKDSPPYLHDGRLLTIEDTVEFFNIVLQAKLDRKDRAALVDYLRTL